MLSRVRHARRGADDMKRRLFIIPAAAASLLLCTALIALWSRSYRFTHSLMITRAPRPPMTTITFWPPNVCLIDSQAGQLRCFLFAGRRVGRNPRAPWRASNERFKSWPAGSTEAGKTWSGYQQLNLFQLRRLAGFEAIWGTTRGFQYYPFCAATVPSWFLVLLTAWLPSRLLYRGLQQKRRLASGLCLRCGYDMRASADRCPECSTVVTQIPST